MPNSYIKIREYLKSLEEQYHLQICIKDFCGFIPINKDLDFSLQPFLVHTNSFCMYIKSDDDHYRDCLSMIRLMYNKSNKVSSSYFGMCHAGLGEYVIPIRSGNSLIGTINVGFFQINDKRTHQLIKRTCRRHAPLDAEKAFELYHTCIRNSDIDIATILPGLELLAEYLGQTYRLLEQTHRLIPQTKNRCYSSEDNILAHAIEYLKQNVSNNVSIADVAHYCHCSQSYLSRIFKRRIGVNVSVYINKMRVEIAKEHLMTTKERITEIALKVGYNDPNYFSRVFIKLVGIPPTEFRRRFYEKND